MTGLLVGLALVIAGQLYAQRDNVNYRVESYVPNANFPVALAFAPDGRLFYTEKFNGVVRVVQSDGSVQRQPVISVQVSTTGERGMLGITLDPDYEENGYIWVVYTNRGDPDAFPANNLVRFREQDGIGYDPQVMLSVPITNDKAIHNGGNVYFDADGLLYLSLGDYDDPANSQNLDTLPGKIHRFAVTDDGLVPTPDNSFPDNSIYAYGLRNPFDFVIDPISGQIFAAENGPECDDQILLVLPGMNYGWQPGYECGVEPFDLENYRSPLLSFEIPEAPAGITMYTHAAIPQWYGDLLFCSFNSGIMRRAILNETRTEIVGVHEIDLQDARCMIDIEVGPDGAIYFTTPNEIYRLVVSG